MPRDSQHRPWQCPAKPPHTCRNRAGALPAAILQWLCGRRVSLVVFAPFSAGVERPGGVRVAHPACGVVTGLMSRCEKSRNSRMARSPPLGGWSCQSSARVQSLARMASLCPRNAPQLAHETAAASSFATCCTLGLCRRHEYSCCLAVVTLQTCSPCSSAHPSVVAAADQRVTNQRGSSGFHSLTGLAAGVRGRVSSTVGLASAV